MATVPMTTTAKEVEPREYTQLERALYGPRFADDLARFLGSEEAAASLVAEIFNQARRLPDLHQCTMTSIRLNVARIAALRLNPALPNMVHFIPRKMEQPKQNERDRPTYALELTLQYGYAGLRELVMRSPEVIDCFTRDVREKDEYEPPADLISPPLHRLPARFQSRGRVEGYYATIKLANGHWRTLQMSVAEVEAHRTRYVKSPGPAWERGSRPDVTDGLTSFDKMALKTVLRMLCNGRDVPMSAEVREALHMDADHPEPTAAELQGYDRQGNRPALTESTGLPLDDLMQEVYGTRDKVAVEREMAQATQGQRHAEAAPPIDVDPQTGVVLNEAADDEAPTVVESKSGRVTRPSGRQQAGQGQMAFDAKASAAIDAELAEDEAGNQPSNPGVEGSN